MGNQNNNLLKLSLAEKSSTNSILQNCLSTDKTAWEEGTVRLQGIISYALNFNV